MKIANDTTSAAVTAAAIRTDIAAQEWKGPWRRYDILKEGVVAIVQSHRYSSGHQPADVAAALKRWDTAGPRQTAWATTFDTALNERPMSASWKTARPANLAATISAADRTSVEPASPPLRFRSRPWLSAPRS